MVTATANPAPGQAPLTPEAFVAALREQSPRYHHKHPFHMLMNEGRLDRTQIQTWVANRFYYQKNIPVKDAAILSTDRCAKILTSSRVKLGYDGNNPDTP
jgi:coenzyme PQQ biosynthesis protein C